MSVNQPEESFTKFEQDLAQAMRGIDPPEGFAERVLARAQASEQPRARVLAMPRRLPLWTSGAIAAALLVGVFAGDQLRARHQRERAQLAQQQFEAGVRITDETLEHTREQLAQAGVRFGE
jgi:type VI protein secretion system component VasF